MVSFDKIYQLALKNCGSEQALLERLPSCSSAKALEQQGDDRYLSAMSRCIFRAGFVWKVIDNKWPGFEEAFDGFNPMAVAHYSNDKIDQLAEDTRIVRNRTKIKAVRDNAVWVLDIQREYGSVGKLLAGWPGEEVVKLWWLLKASGSRLGGNTGPMMLRLMGKDTFILTNDVLAALTNYAFLDSVSPNSKRDQQAVQSVFNDLQQQCQRPLCEISRILALAVG